MLFMKSLKVRQAALEIKIKKIGLLQLSNSPIFVLIDKLIYVCFTETPTLKSEGFLCTYERLIYLTLPFIKVLGIYIKFISTRLSLSKILLYLLAIV